MRAVFLTQVRGVALLALRASFRARVVMFLMLLQMVCALSLPHVVKGDGTPAGDLEILLTYTLGFCFAIQALASLWASCSLFAGEIASLRIQMSVVKPVGFFALWLGKWCALLLLNALLLIIVYALVYAQVKIAERQRGWGPETIPAARHWARPLLPSPAEEARMVYARLEKAGELPKDLSRAEILEALEEQARERYDILNPGDELRLDFRLNRPVRPEDSIVLRLKFDTAYGTRRHVRGVCRLFPTDDPAGGVERRLENVTQSVIHFPFKAASFTGSGAKGPPLRSFSFVFRFEGDDADASALLLRLRQDAVMMIPGGSFEMNLVRSAFVQGGVLAVLSAFGLALSACFSFPVASFVAGVVLALVMISGGVLPMVTKEDEKVLVGRIGIEVLKATRYVTGRITESAPLTAVANGERINRRTLLVCALWNMGLVPLAFALLACGTLRRRELADA